MRHRPLTRFGDWSPFTAVAHLPENRQGRDFVVGDIHGAFALVDDALEAVDFSPDADRLFCVGDLIDRGPDSRAVARFLARPYVHALCGNHEATLLALHMEGTPEDAALAVALRLTGATWWLDVPHDEREPILAALAQLPLAMEVATERGSVGFVHADVPAGMDWPAFLAALERDDADVIHAALWGRERLTRGSEDGVRGIGRLYVGHTPMWQGLVRRGNVYAVDSGAVFGLTGRIPEGRLTLAEIGMATAALVAPRPHALVDVRAGEVPATPFGRYAA